MEEGGGGDRRPPITHIRNGIKRFLYIQIAYLINLILLKNVSVLKVLNLKIASKLAFLKNVKKKSSFSKCSFRNELHAPCLPYIDTQHFTM